MEVLSHGFDDKLFFSLPSHFGLKLGESAENLVGVNQLLGEYGVVTDLWLEELTTLDLVGSDVFFVYFLQVEGALREVVNRVCGYKIILAVKCRVLVHLGMEFLSGELFPLF